MSFLKPLKNPVYLKVEEGQDFVWGNAKNWTLFAGPDIFEDTGLVLETAQEINTITARLNIPWILKCSYDKANRSSLRSFRGPGKKKALLGLEKIKSDLKCPLLTDVHETHQVESVSKVAEILQIPAFLSRQTDLIVEAAKKAKVLHIKKGQFMAPWDLKGVIEKAKSVKQNNLLLCERGTFFGYNRLVCDMGSLFEMRALGYPVIMDASHSVQRPSSEGYQSGGKKEWIPILARAAMAAGVDGLFLEVHPNPNKALCDGPNSWPLQKLEKLLSSLKKISNLTI